MTAYFILNSWAGATKYQVEIIGQTPKKYRCKLLDNVPLKGKKIGDVMLVPKDAIKND